MSEHTPSAGPQPSQEATASHDFDPNEQPLPAISSSSLEPEERDVGGLEESESSSSLPPLEGLLPIMTYDDVPDVEEMLARLVSSTSALSKSFDATVKSSAAHVGEITEFMVSELVLLSTQAASARDSASAAADQSRALLIRAAQLERQLARLPRLEAQVAQVERLLPQLEAMVDQRVARAEAEKTAAAAAARLSADDASVGH